MAAKLGQKKKGQKVKKPVQPVNDIEKDSNVVLTKTPEEVNVKREKAKAAEKKEDDDPPTATAVSSVVTTVALSSS